MANIIFDKMEKRFFCAKPDGDSWLYLNKDGKYKNIVSTSNMNDFYFEEKKDISELLPE